jgi:geranylgeranyl pyrophosphate synthase
LRGGRRRGRRGPARAGRRLGLAFQIIDDILDVTGDNATLGKTAGKDARAGKATYVKLHGLATAQRLAHEQTEAAIEALKKLPGDRAFLEALTAQHGDADQVGNRDPGFSEM